jgi:hypothetical protein
MLHMLQVYVLNVSYVLYVRCSKSSMLQVFHETRAVPTGRASVMGGAAGRGQATAGRAERGKQKGEHACSDARP